MLRWCALTDGYIFLPASCEVMYRCALYTVFALQGVIGHLERTLGEEFQLSFKPNMRIRKKCDRCDFDGVTIKDARRVWVSWKLLISRDFFLWGLQRKVRETEFSPKSLVTWDQGSKTKMLLGSGLTDPTVVCCMQMVGSEFGVNNMNPWIRPASCQGSGLMLEL